MRPLRNAVCVRHCGQPRHNARTCPVLLADREKQQQHTLTPASAKPVPAQRHAHHCSVWRAKRQHTGEHAHTRTHTCTHTHTHTHTHTCARAHAHTRTRRHTYTHVHTHIYVLRAWWALPTFAGNALPLVCIAMKSSLYTALHVLDKIPYLAKLASCKFYNWFYIHSFTCRGGLFFLLRDRQFFNDDCHSSLSPVVIMRGIHGQVFWTQKLALPSESLLLENTN